MTEPRNFHASTSVTVDHGKRPRVHHGESGIVLVYIADPDGAAEVILTAASPAAFIAWAADATRTVEALLAPVLPLDDVLSTHPAEVAG